MNSPDSSRRHERQALSNRFGRKMPEPYGKGRQYVFFEMKKIPVDFLQNEEYNCPIEIVPGQWTARPVSRQQTNSEARKGMALPRSDS